MRLTGPGTRKSYHRGEAAFANFVIFGGLAVYAALLLVLEGVLHG